MIIYHLPLLGIAEGASASALGGTLRRLAFEEFAELDSDWAHPNYFVRHSAAWEVPEETGGSDWDADYVARADLVRLAAAAVLEAPIASPRLSIRYSGLGGEWWSRRIGPFGRTLLLRDETVAIADQAALEAIGALADRWAAAGYDADHPVFIALAAHGAVYSAFAQYPELAMMPTMVALEGLIAPQNLPGIASRLAATLAGLLPDDPGVERTVKRLYDLRSDIIHGRPLDAEAAAATGIAGELACRATVALIERGIARGTPPARWESLLEMQP